MLKIQSAAAVIIAAGLAALSTPASADDTGFAGSHAWAKVGGRTCFADHSHVGNGDGPTKPAALKAAIRSWADFTAFEYGSDWARYGLAASRNVSYTKAEKGWSAMVDARPCKG